MVNLELGSVYRRIHIDWLIKGLQGGAITEKNDGEIVPLVYIYAIDEVVGKTGRTAITQKKEVLNLDRFNNFAQLYNAFLYAQEKEAEASMSLAKQSKF